MYASYPRVVIVYVTAWEYCFFYVHSVGRLAMPKIRGYK